MKKAIAILALFAVSAMAVTAGEIQQLHTEMLILMDKYTWETYINPYTGEEVEVTPQERAVIKAQAVAKYQEHRDAVLLYAEQLGIIEP